MNRARTTTIFLLVILLTMLAASDTAQWSKVRARMTGDTGYSLHCDYDGPEGQFFFRYVVHGNGQAILTEVLQGSSRGAGTRIYYNPSLDRDNVTMQTSFLRLRRSLEARDIKDSPLYIPLFAHIVDEFGADQPEELRHAASGTTEFVFGDTAAQHEVLTVDKNGNPLVVRRLEAEKEVNRLTFHDLEWGEKPIDWEN